MEIWKTFDDIAGFYEVSNMGRIKSIDRLKRSKTGTWFTMKGGILSPKTDKYGYKAITLNMNGKKGYYTIHRLIAMAFLGVDKGKQVNHKNGLRDDNRIENLEWVTCSENVRHSYNVLGKKANITTAKPITVFNKDFEPMFIFASIVNAANCFDWKVSNISHAASGRNHSAYGLKWKFN